MREKKKGNVIRLDESNFFFLSWFITMVLVNPGRYIFFFTHKYVGSHVGNEYTVSCLMFTKWCCYDVALVPARECLSVFVITYLALLSDH